MKRFPKCIYGHKCYSVCVNSQCLMPAFMCETGSKQLDQCGSFHQKCQRIIWSDIQKVVNYNPRKKIDQFNNLEQKFDNMFLILIKSIQQEHLKFKTWITTYGHNIEIMKFIKNVNDQNYKHIDGRNMDMLVNQLFGNDKNTIQTPQIKQSDFLNYFEKLKVQIDSLSDIYLKQSHHSNHSSRNENHILNQEILPVQIKSKLFQSMVINDISQINHFFDGKIKNLKLLYRASDYYFNITQFHNKCDNIPHTLTILENQFGKIFGGYTPLVWNSNKKTWSYDKEQKTFIFSLDLRQKYKLNLPQFAIANNPQRGPIFGCCDIFISDNADKQKSGCQFPISFNNGKYSRKPETSQILTGTKKGKFLIKQWQVYQIQFTEPY